MLLPNPVEACQPVHLRHPDIEKNEVGIRSPDHWQDLTAAGRLAHDLHVVCLLEHESSRLEYQPMVIGDQNSKEPHLPQPSRRVCDGPPRSSFPKPATT